MKKEELIPAIVSYLLIVMFLYTAVSKLIIFPIYKLQMDGQPFPDALTPFLVVVIPGSEFIASGLLAIPATRTKGLYMSTVMMLIFTIYIILIKANTFGHIPCSCGGVLNNFTWNQHLIFNCFFLALCFLALYTERSRKQNLAF